MDLQQIAERQNILDTIYKKAPYLNPALRRIADFIIAQPEQCKTMTIKELAIACDVAESTVTRFVKEIDLKSYQDLKIAIAEALFGNDAMGAQPEERYVYEGIARTDSASQIIDKVVYRNIQTLIDTRLRLNAELIEQAAQAIAEANVLVFCGMGSSAVAAEEAVMRFTRAGKKCILFRDQGIQRMTAAIVNAQDVVIGISNSGRSTSVVTSLKTAQVRGARAIAITSFENSPLCKCADICLLTPTQLPPPGLDLYGESTTSVTAQIMVVDVLYATFAARHFDETLQSLEETYEAAIRDSRE